MPKSGRKLERRDYFNYLLISKRVGSIRTLKYIILLVLERLLLHLILVLFLHCLFSLYTELTQTYFIHIDILFRVSLITIVRR